MISSGICLEERKIAESSNRMFMFDCMDKLLIFPQKGAVCIEVEKETLRSENNVLPELEDGLQHCFTEITDTQILIESYKRNIEWHLSAGEKSLVYDYLKKKVTWKDLEDADENCQAELEKIYAEAQWDMAKKGNGIIIEEPEFGLDLFCRLLHGDMGKTPDTMRLCGEKIHEVIMKEL